jgi:SNF2 family DNA or RNA helicase
MTAKQRKAYNDIAQRSLIELESGEELSVANVLTKALRLQQVVGGFLPKEEFAPAEPIEDKNPRIDCLVDLLEETEGKVIIWARFRAELAAIEDALRKAYGREAVVSYHGGVGKEDREHNMDTFQDLESPVRFFVGQPHSGGYGLTLHAATTVIYFSNDFSLEARLQSEDRAHRIGQHHPVLYVDLECLGTIDTKIIEALRDKKSLADLITRDSVRQLLARAA